ncbi:hypothetical protein CW304_24770 [Bacillus sp. UFRGS-B20]|nr:hypothetical protein CW304_24770 [Bacillus sp. UFRGS-B20]
MNLYSAIFSIYAGDSPQTYQRFFHYIGEFPPIYQRFFNYIDLNDKSRQFKKHLSLLLSIYYNLSMLKYRQHPFSFSNFIHLLA